MHIIDDQIRQLDLDRSLLHTDMVSLPISTCTNLMDGGKIRFVTQFATRFEVACSIIETPGCLISVRGGLYHCFRITLFCFFDVTLVTLGKIK